MTLERESKRFAGNVGVCWHEWPKATRYDMGRVVCTICGAPCMPLNAITYTIELIVAELKRIGKWEGFVKWHFLACSPMYHDHKTGLTGHALHIWAHAEVITTPLLLLQAASAYIEEEREDAVYQTQQVMEDR